MDRIWIVVMTDRSTCARLYAAVARRSMASTFCGCCSITLSSSASYIHTPNATAFR